MASRLIYFFLIFLICDVGFCSDLYINTDIDESSKLNVDTVKVSAEITQAFDCGLVQQQSMKDKSFFIFSLSSSILGAMPFFDLGYDMVPSNRGGAVALGIVSMSPVIIMGTQFTNFILHEIERQICSQPTESLQKVLRNKTRCEKLADGVWNIGVTTVGAVSAGPLTYLNNIFWDPKIGLWSLVFDIPTFYVKMIADIWAMKNLASQTSYMFRTYFCPRIIRDYFGGRGGLLRARINHLLDDATKVIDQLQGDSKAVDDLIRVTSIEREGNQVDPLKRIRYLLQPNTFLGSLGEGIQVHPTPKSRYFFQFIGGVLGAFSMAAVEPLASQGVTDTLASISSFNASSVDPQQAMGIDAVSWLATISAGSLMSFATADSFGKLYDFTSSLPTLLKKVTCCSNCDKPQPNDTSCEKKIEMLIRNRGTIATVSSLFAVGAAIPNAALSYRFLGVETAYDRFAFASSIIAPLATYFWAIDEFFLKLEGMFDPRAPLYFKIHTLRRLLDQTSLEHIQGLLVELQREKDTEARHSV